MTMIRAVSQSENESMGAMRNSEDMILVTRFQPDQALLLQLPWINVSMQTETEQNKYYN